MTTRKLDLAQFERTCSDDMAQVDRVFLLAECKRQREETTRLRLIVERFAMYSPMGISADEQPEFARNVAKARAALAST